MTFAIYTDAVLAALRFNPKADDVIARKQEILDGVFRAENLEPASILFVGFNPAILSCRAKNISVTEVTETGRDYLTKHGAIFNYIKPADLPKHKKAFQCVVAMDEYFTFAASDAEQQLKISTICSLASDFVISTVRDYKNQDFKDREFSIPMLVRNGSNKKVFTELHEWDLTDRTRWITSVYEIDNPGNTLTTYGPFDRRTMFFKQLAKFSIDAGAANFLVHKNLMYKSLIKKNYEHVVSIQF